MSTRRTPLRKRPSDQAAIAAQPPAAAAPSGADEAEGAIEREVRAKLLGMLQTPATRIASVLQAPGGQLARVLAAYAKKGEAA